MTKRIKMLQSRLTDGEVKMVEALCERLGGIKCSDMIRRLIQERYKKEFPVYMEKRGTITSLGEDLTPEQICEMNGGKVYKGDNGMVMCGLTVGGAVYGIPVAASE